MYLYCADFAPCEQLINKQVLVSLHSYFLLYIRYMYTIYKVILKEKYNFHLIFYAISSKIKMSFIFNYLTSCVV